MTRGTTIGEYNSYRVTGSLKGGNQHMSLLRIKLLVDPRGKKAGRTRLDRKELGWGNSSIKQRHAEEWPDGEGMPAQTLKKGKKDYRGERASRSLKKGSFRKGKRLLKKKGGEVSYQGSASRAHSRRKNAGTGLAAKQRQSSANDAVES